MDFSIISGTITIISLLIFVGIIYWAYARQNKERFEAIGKSLLEIDKDKQTTGK